MSLKVGDLVKVKYFADCKIHIGIILSVDNGDGLRYYWVLLPDGYKGWWSSRQIEELE